MTQCDWEFGHAEISFLVNSTRSREFPLSYAQDCTHFLSLLCQVAFMDLQFHRLFTETFAFRKTHIALLESFGLKKEGTLREHVYKNGHWHDSVVHGILAEEWTPSKFCLT